MLGYGNAGGLPLQDFATSATLIFAKMNGWNYNTLATINHMCARDSHRSPSQNGELVTRAPGNVVLQCSLDLLHLGSLGAFSTEYFLYRLEEGHREW